MKKVYRSLLSATVLATSFAFAQQPAKAPAKQAAVAAKPAPKAENPLTYGPWLTYPTPTSIVVGLTTIPGYGAGVQYREKGTQKWQEKWHTVAGQIFKHRSPHTIQLKNLKPDTEYEYRLVFLKPSQREYYDGPNGKNTLAREPQLVFNENPQFHFRTYPDKGKDFAFALCSDLQFNLSVKTRILSNYFKNCNIDDARFFGVVGDGHNDLGNFEACYLKTIIENLNKFGGYSRPGIFIRGNHEWRGIQASLWCEYFGAPDTGSTYFSFKCGDVLFIVLDSGEDKPSRKYTFHYTGNNVEEKAFFDEQRDWFQNLLKTPDFKNAKYRIMLCHSAIFSHSQPYMSNYLKHVCGDLLTKKYPENKIHLWVTGHTHNYVRTIPGNNNQVVAFTPPRHPIISGKDYDFPIITLDGPNGGGVDNSLLYVKVTADKLIIESKDETGRLFDKLEILSDGTCVDTNNDTLAAKKITVKTR